MKVLEGQGRPASRRALVFGSAPDERFNAVVGAFIEDDPGGSRVA